MIKKNPKKVIKLASIILLFALAIFLLLDLKDSGKGGQNAGQYLSGVLPVIVSSPKSELVFMDTQLPARVVPYQVSPVRPQITGVIEELKFTEGSFVNQGEALYQIESQVYRAKLRQAEINLNNLNLKYQRYKELLKIDAISKEEYEIAGNDLSMALFQYEDAKKQLEHTKVLAPISGFISKSNVTEGALVTANQVNPIAYITKLSPTYVDIIQPSKYNDLLKEQGNIAVSLRVNGKEIEERGYLKFSEIYADPETDSILLRSQFANSDNILVPGTFVTAILHLKPFQAVTIPLKATVRENDGSLAVWVVDQSDQVRKVVINASKTFKDQWVVESGVGVEDIIVIEGSIKLVEGMKVRPEYISDIYSKDVTNNENFIGPRIIDSKKYKLKSSDKSFVGPALPEKYRKEIETTLDNFIGPILPDQRKEQIDQSLVQDLIGPNPRKEEGSRNLKAFSSKVIKSPKEKEIIKDQELSKDDFIGPRVPSYSQDKVDEAASEDFIGPQAMVN